MALFKGRELVFKTLESKIFSKLNESEQWEKGTRVKILTSKKMLQKLLIALTQVKAGDNSENCCSFFVPTKKNYNNIIIKKYKIP